MAEAKKEGGGPAPKYPEGHGLGVPEVSDAQKIKNLERLLDQGPTSVSRELIEQRIRQLQQHASTESASAK